MIITMKTVKLIKLKSDYYFIPITEQDYDYIKEGIILYNRAPEKNKELTISNLPNTYINTDLVLKYSNVIAIGTTEFNKKLCEKILDSHQFNSKYKGGYTYEPITAWQCFAGFKDINGIPYWRSGINGITHPDVSVSWNCLIQSTNNPTHAIIVQISNVNENSRSNNISIRESVVNA